MNDCKCLMHERSSAECTCMCQHDGTDPCDAEVSHCLDCGDWRWRASYLPCQRCGGRSYAERICPPGNLSPEQYETRWRAAERTWTRRPVLA